MAVTESKLFAKTGIFSINAESSHEWHYYVRTDSNADPVDVYVGAQTASPDPIPKEYDGHPTDLSAYALSIETTQQAEYDFKKWIVKVRWGKLPAGTDVDNGEDPILWPIQYYLRWKYVTEEVKIAANGAPIKTTARTKPEQYPVRERRLPVLVAERNFGTLAEIIAINEAFDNKRNDSPFFNADVAQAAFEGIEASRVKYLNGIAYYTGAISILFDYSIDPVDPRDASIDNVSFDVWNADPGWTGGGDVTEGQNSRAAGNTAKLKAAEDKDKQLRSAPAILDSVGRDAEVAGTTEQERVDYLISDLADFSALGVGG